jgi:cytochrome c oxidase assembly protein subunit 15
MTPALAPAAPRTDRLADRIATAPAAHRRSVARWLLLCCGMIFAMVVIGGITRLTESGLSIVEWQPFTGALPPMSDAEWQRLFDLYRQTPEYQAINRGMSLAEFREIFWWEWIHRFWGRLIGLVFLLPLLWFLIRRRIPAGLTPYLVVAFVLGAAQGTLGWFMVASGLAERTDVSQYRLVAHLLLAFAIYIYLFWLALLCLGPPKGRVAPANRRRLHWFAVLLSITVAMGAFTAGLNGGFVYNEFPLMGGALLPEDALASDPVWINPFENPVAAQFVHRWLAVATVIAALALWFGAPHEKGRATRGRPLDLLAAIALVQFALGIATLLTVVWLPVAVLHQAGAVLLLTALTWTLYEAALYEAALYEARA